MMLSFAPMVQATPPLTDLVLDGEWDFKYYADAAEVPEDVTTIVFEDKIQVPGAMELLGYGYPSYYFEEQGGWGQPEDDGVRSAGVYKLDFEINEWYAGEESLVFESFMDNMTVYLDGKKLEDSSNGAIGAVFDVNLKEGKHTLICVVKRDKSGINKVDDFATSGITGSVYLTPYAVSYQGASCDVKVENGKLYIDGEEVVLKGVRYTPTHPETGRSMTDDQIAYDISLIKQYGFNAIWTSAAPAALYEAAEENGLYVIDEANIWLENAERDELTAARRVNHMVEMHDEYPAIIMWSVGSGNGNAQSLIENIKKLDNRPVAQEVTFAEDFEVFGNTGGMADWVATLGDGNVGGFVDEFADKELYYTQNAYVFDVKDSATGETVTIDGEVENYKGIDMLGDATFARSIDALDKYTIVTELSAVGGDRVIFENGNVKLEIRNNRVRFNANGQSVRADVQEGKIAAVYADGEIQLFANNTFAGNAAVEAQVAGDYTVGGGETAIGYIEIYNDALSLDELIEGADESKLISRVDFDDITIKEDKSYKFLAYGGDFGDSPNSYYKCLTGIFSSTREPHPEAEAFRALLEEPDLSITGMFGKFGKDNAVDNIEGVDVDELAKIAPVKGENSVVWQGEKVKAEVSFDGKIMSFVNEGKELLLEPMYPTVLRENTLFEYEMGVENREDWRSGKAEVEGNTFYVELISTETDGRLVLLYTMTEDGVLHVSMQSNFADEATKPTFIGFRGVGNYTTATWCGEEVSEYPDRWIENIEKKEYTLPIEKMSDNYTIAQENGNKMANWFALENENGNAITFSGNTILNCQVHNYSPEEVEDVERIADAKKEDKAYFRIGGYIAGVSDNSKYKLNENVYGYSLSIAPGIVKKSYMGTVWAIWASDSLGYFNDFTPGIETYVYRTNDKVEITGIGEDVPVVQDDKKAVVNGDYTVYFAPATEYMSDMATKEATAEIAKDSDFNGNAITMSGNDYWAPATVYDKGLAIKGGSVTYDVSGMTNHTFNAVVGKNSIDWRSMGGGFDRNMFDASCTVSIALDGVVVEEIKDISMRGGSREVNIDVSNASELTITVTGSGRAPQYEDAVIANAAFVPNGPVVVNFEKNNGEAEITVLNTDKEYVDVVLSATENGVVTTATTRIGKGLYRTISVKAADAAKVQAVITGLGTVTLE